MKSADVATRRRQEATYYRLVAGQTETWVARRFAVTPRTVRRWVAAVLEADDAVSLMLQAVAERGFPP